MRRLLFLIITIYFLPIEVVSQSADVNGALLVGANISLGNQNQLFNFSLKGVGTFNYGDAAVEAGATIYLNRIFKRHTVQTNGISIGYEVFSLAGIGGNDNLLGASLFENSASLIFDAGGNGGFKGLGFGFQRELLPNKLSVYTPRRASIMVRVSNDEHSFQLAFRNDLKLGNIINGQATDYAATGSLVLSYSNITSFHSAYLAGVAFDVFTPQPDYSKTPINRINSDDGRRNVWFVLPPFENLFYANLYGFGTYQDQFYALGGSLGVNSSKLGAYVQNTLHDSFGLNPRYPWDVAEKDTFYYELRGGINIQAD